MNRYTEFIFCISFTGCVIITHTMEQKNTEQKTKKETHEYTQLNTTHSIYDPAKGAEAIETTKTELRQRLKLNKRVCYNMPNSYFEGFEVDLVNLRQQQKQWHRQIAETGIVTAYQNFNEKVEVDLSNSLLQSTYTYDDPHQYKMLTNLNISHNILQELPLYIIAKVCPNLTELDASDNSISFISHRNDTDYSIAKLPRLKTLLLQNNALANFSFDDCFSMSPNLETVNLRANELTKYCWTRVPKWAYGESGQHTWPKIDIRETQLSTADSDKLEGIYRTMAIECFRTISDGEKESCASLMCCHTISLVAGVAVSGLTGLITGNLWYFLGGGLASIGTVCISGMIAQECYLPHMKAYRDTTRDQRIVIYALAKDNVLRDNVQPNDLIDDQENVMEKL